VADKTQNKVRHSFSRSSNTYFTFQ
jgi:hypothetical protein